MSLHRKTAVSVLWNMIEQIGKRGITGIVTVLLARFLAPEDFGLIAMITVFIQIANSIMDSGFRQALIQKKNIDDNDLCTVFYSNILLGLISYILLFLTAPFVAKFYNEPRLILLIRIIGISIIINSFKIVQEAVLSKKLDFKSIVFASLPGTIVSGIIAIILAYNGFGVWSLVFQMIIYSLVNSFFLWRSYRWQPKLIFSIKSFERLYSFGSKLFLSGILNIIFQNIFIIVIAKIFSPKEAGYYFFAFKLQQIVVFQLNDSLNKATFSALSLIQNDQDKLKQGIRELISVLTFIIFPVVLFSSALAYPIFKVFLSPTWLPAHIYMQLLFLAGMIIPLHTINLNILRVKGRSDLFLLLSVIKKIIVSLVLFVSFKYGIIAILVGQIITSFINYIPNSFFSKRLINYSVSEQLNDVMLPFISSSVISLILYLLVGNLNFSDLLELLLLLVCGSIFYISIFLYLKKDMLKYIISLINR